jgi:hypothetical protein
MIYRPNRPGGVAALARHLDDQPSVAGAARELVTAVTGLTVAGLQEVGTAWLPYPCRRDPVPRPQEQGHRWTVYRAQAIGRLTLDTTVAPAACWCTREQLHELARRTIDHARDRLDVKEFTRRPGLQPPWVSWLIHAGLIQMDPADLLAIDELGRRPDERR